MLSLLSLLRPDKRICNGCYSDVQPPVRKHTGRVSDLPTTTDGAGGPTVTRRKKPCCVSSVEDPTANPARNPPLSRSEPAKKVDEGVKPCQVQDTHVGGDAVTDNKNSSADRPQYAPQEGPNPYAQYVDHPPAQYQQYQQPQYYPPPGYSVQEGMSVPYQNPQSHIIYVIPPQDHAYTNSSQTTVVMPQKPHLTNTYPNQQEFAPPGQQIIVIAVKPFDDPVKRATFVRRVYGILLVQLLVTSAAVSCSMFVPQVKSWIMANPFWIYVFMFLYLACVILMCCLTPYMLSTNCLSLLVLVTLTIGLAGVLSFITVTKSQESVLIATGITTACVLGLTMVACCCKYDFTGLYAIVFVFFFILILFGIMASLLYQHIPILKLVYAVLGALIMCIYIVMDTQMLMGGKRHELDTDMYIFGAIMLYIDIVVLFMYILDIVDSAKS